MARLLQERRAPELLYVETRFAAVMSYGVTVDVLADIVPIGAQRNAAVGQRHLLYESTAEDQSA